MNLKTKVKSYSFWVSLASAVILILKLVGQRFGFEVDEGLISDLFTSLCAILVILGIINVPSAASVEQKSDLTSVKVQNSENQTSKSCQAQQLSDEEFKQINQAEEEAEDTQENKLVEVQEENSSEIETVVVSNDEITDATPETELASEEVYGEIVTESNSNSGLGFNLENFIDKVCSKRAELNNNVLKFSEFLQNELENIKKFDN